MIDLDEIKSRINPHYANRRGSESHERKILCDEIECLRQQLSIAETNQRNVEETHKITLREVQRESMRLQTENDILRQQLAEKSAESDRRLDLMNTLDADNEQLRQQLAEKAAEIERLKSENRDACIGLNDYFGQQLAASQAREQQLRENVRWALDLNCCQEFAECAAVLQEVLALPQDTTALDQLEAQVAHWAGEVMRGRIRSTLHSELFDSTLRRNLCSKVRALPGVTLEDLQK